MNDFPEGTYHAVILDHCETVMKDDNLTNLQMVAILADVITVLTKRHVEDSK